MKKIIIPILAATALLCGCQKEAALEQSANLVPVTISTSMTKTSLDGLNVLWTDGDQISIVADDNKAYTFTLTEGAGTATASFVGSLPETATPKYAIYPKNDEAATANINNYYKGDSSNKAAYTVTALSGFEYPTTQAAIAGSAEVIPSFGVVSGTAPNYSVRMKNTGLLFKVILPETLTDIVSVSLSSVNGCSLTGTFCVDVSDANIDNVYTIARTWDTQVILSNGGNVIAPGAYYMSAMYYINGITTDTNIGRNSLSTMMLKLQKADGKVAYVKLTGGPAKAARGTIYPIDLTDEAISWGTSETIVFDFATCIPADFPSAKNDRTTEDVTISVGGHDFVLNAFETSKGQNGWVYSTSSGALSNYYYNGSTKVAGQAFLRLPDDFDGNKLREVYFSTNSQNKTCALVDSLQGSNSRLIAIASARESKPTTATEGIVRQFIDQDIAVGTDPDYNYGYFLKLSHSGSFNIYGNITCVYLKPEN